jgi:resuscitation-promoting factor RpfB
LLRSVKYGLYGAVLAGLVGGTVAFTATGDKSVHLLVDGTPRTVHTTASSVGAMLHKAGYHPSGHDLIAPSPSSRLEDGETVVFRRGRLLHLSVDGTDRYVWTTAPTVATALADLGFATSDFTSVSRSRRLPLGVTSIDVRTPRTVTVDHDRLSTSVTTTDATVGQLLDDLSVNLGSYDRVSPPQYAELAPGMTVKVTRVVHTTLRRMQSIPFHTHTLNDPRLMAGNTTIMRTGHRGLRELRWAVVYVDGKLVGKAELPTVLMRRPSDQVQKVGTKQSAPNTSNAPTPSPGSNQAIAKAMLPSYGWGGDQYNCLVEMWNRESGWRIDASNASGAYGIPQALPGSKMASAGPNWQTNPHTQIRWGLGYIKSRYGTPCGAWSLWQSQGWY